VYSSINSLYERNSPRCQLLVRFHAECVLNDPLPRARSCLKDGRFQRASRWVFCRTNQPVKQMTTTICNILLADLYACIVHVLVLFHQELSNSGLCISSDAPMPSHKATELPRCFETSCLCPHLVT